MYEHLAEMGFEVAQSNAAWMYSKGLGITVHDEGWPNKVCMCSCVVEGDGKRRANDGQIIIIVHL